MFHDRTFYTHGYPGGHFTIIFPQNITRAGSDFFHLSEKLPVDCNFSTNRSISSALLDCSLTVQLCVLRMMSFEAHGTRENLEEGAFAKLLLCPSSQVLARDDNASGEDSCRFLNFKTMNGVPRGSLGTTKSFRIFGIFPWTFWLNLLLFSQYIATFCSPLRTASSCLGTLYIAPLAAEDSKTNPNNARLRAFA